MRRNLCALALLLGLTISFDAICTNQSITSPLSLNAYEYTIISLFLLQDLNNIISIILFGFNALNFYFFMMYLTIIKVVSLITIGIFYAHSLTTVSRIVMILPFVNIPILIFTLLCNRQEDTIELKKNVIRISPEIPLNDIVVDCVIQKEEDCPICLQTIQKDGVKTTCNHIFHKECIIKHYTISNNKNCPICREQLEICVKVPFQVTCGGSYALTS